MVDTREGVQLFYELNLTKCKKDDDTEHVIPGKPAVKRKRSGSGSDGLNLGCLNYLGRA